MPFDDMPGYVELVESLVKDCRCCPACHPGGVPCDGLLAGGLCDQATCRCNDADPDYGWDDEEDCDDDD